MISAMRRVLASLRGDGEYSVTVPPMDGALNPNNALEEAEIVAEAQAPGDLCVLQDRLLFSSGDEVRIAESGPGRLFYKFEASVTSLATEGRALAAGLANGKIAIRGGAHDGKVVSGEGDRPFVCVSALAFDGPDVLLICEGSQTHPFDRWKCDLMQLGRGGSVWRADLRMGAFTPLARNLGFPFGVLPIPGGVLVCESWRHRILLLRAGLPPEPVLSDLPAYPARISRSTDGGAWLALFAPRRQLTEFILRESKYRQRMMIEMAPEHWVGPTLAPMASFLEPLQGGTLKKLAAIKPWAPSRSYGLVARLDPQWQPVASYHSRADGGRHGVMSALERGGRLYAASHGADAIVAVDLEEAE